MDPLSDVLSLLRVTGHVSGGLDAGGSWSIGFGRSEGMKFHVILRGECWLVVDGFEPLRVAEGSCVILPHGKPFEMTTDPSLIPLDGVGLAQSAGPGGIATHNGGGDFQSIGGFFLLSDVSSSILLDCLPPLIVLDERSDQDLIRWCIERLRYEVQEQAPGQGLIAQQLAMMMLVQVLRSLPECHAGSSGWLQGLADPQLRRALSAMHGHPARRWTLADLAGVAAMSRTVFATRFRRTVGMAPMEYLTSWRMSLAAERLASTNDAVGAISVLVGYDSKKSFSTAFRRARNASPRKFREAHRADPHLSARDGSKATRRASAEI